MDDSGFQYFVVESEAKAFQRDLINNGYWTSLQGISSPDFTRIDKYKVTWEQIKENKNKGLADGHYLNSDGKSVVVYGDA